MPTHTIVKSYQIASGLLSGQEIVIDDTELNADLLLAPGAVNVELDLALVRAKVKALCFNCAADCTVKTNTTGGADQVALVANTPVICANNTEVLALLPTADVTILFLSSAAGGLFSFRSIIHEGP